MWRPLVGDSSLRWRVMHGKNLTHSQDSEMQDGVGTGRRLLASEEAPYSSDNVDSAGSHRRQRISFFSFEACGCCLVAHAIQCALCAISLDSAFLGPTL